MFARSDEHENKVWAEGPYSVYRISNRKEGRYTADLQIEYTPAPDRYIVGCWSVDREREVVVATAYTQDEAVARARREIAEAAAAVKRLDDGTSIAHAVAVAQELFDSAPWLAKSEQEIGGCLHLRYCDLYALLVQIHGIPHATK